ncbi:MAG: hypothetical protein AAF720_00305 [Pseudomonadota bacterium]
MKTKNIQVIDGADNCAYDVYKVSDEDFKIVFPEEGQDIEFADDLFTRLNQAEIDDLTSRMWQHLLDKPEIDGIHGTLFYELEYKKEFYPTKREAEMTVDLTSPGRIVKK